MGRKKTPGLKKVNGIWNIDKQVNGRRLCESTGTEFLEEAERYLARRLETIRQASIYGVRGKRTFKEAAVKYLLENQHKKSISSEAQNLKILDPFIGYLFLESIHMGTLQSYIDTRRRDGVKARTINYGLQMVRRILNLSASEWMDDFGLTWLVAAPKIKLISQKDARKPYPLDWDEQERLIRFLAPHLADMFLFAVNTGCRDQEICQLRWQWEVRVPIPEMGSVFVIPGAYTKNGEDRLVVLNRVARTVIERQRGKHDSYVFVYKGSPVGRMLNNGWRRARDAASLLHVRVHDLKHTYGRRLRAVGVSFEDRQDLLGHKSSRITTHYSSAELLNLWHASNKVCEGWVGKPTLTLLRSHEHLAHAKVTHELVLGEAI